MQTTTTTTTTTGNTDKRGIPSSVRFLDRLPSPIAAALTAAVILTAGYLLGESITGHLQRVLSGNANSLGLRATATLCVLVAYVPLAHLYLRRWTGRHLAALRASFGGIDERAQSATASVFAGLLGAATFFALFIIVPNFFTGFRVINFQLIAATVSGTLYGWLAGRFLVCMVKDSMLMSRLARALPDLDLLDLNPLTPFVQQGLKSVLLTMIVLALTSHLFIAPGDAVIGSSAFLLIFSGLTFMVFTLPVRGIHDRLVREKQSQLDRIRSEIRDVSEQVLSQQDGQAGGRLSGLLDLEARLERVREWPFDASSWFRFGLYMLVGLGSWLGAAAVERLLDSLL